MAAEATRSSVLKKLEGVANKHAVEIVRAHMKPRTDGVAALLNLESGYWENRGDYQKPRRWLFHILPEEGGFKVSFPEHATHRVLGAISTTSDTKRKALLTFRLFPLVKMKEKEFRPYPAWDWMVWIAFKKILPPSLGNSAVVKNLDLGNETISVEKRQLEVTGVGLVALSAPDDVLGLLPDSKITYGEVTTKLVQLLTDDSVALTTTATGVKELSGTVEVSPPEIPEPVGTVAKGDE